MIKRTSVKKKASVQRMLLNTESANNVSELVKKLREHSCKTDTSKTVNVILSIFFQKYCSVEHGNIVRELFDKKSYLRNLINTSSSEAIDESIKQYLMGINSSKRRRRKVKHSPKINGLQQRYRELREKSKIKYDP